MSKERRKIEALAEAGLIEPDTIDELVDVGKNFSVSISPHLIELIKNSDPLEQANLKKQFVPDVQELAENHLEQSDPIGDKRHSPVKGIVHRYPDRCLLLPITVCPVYCRFCFRREVVGQKEQTLTENELENAYTYIKEHKEIWEVIITGGEPLILKPSRLKKIMQKLAEIEHVEVLRIHTRMPVMDPEKITEALIESLRTTKTLYVVLHTNHPGELIESVQTACARFIDKGIPMLSQTVLLKGVNDDPLILGKLMRALVKNRIKPYYLHHGDLAKGTQHFRTTLKKGQSLIKALRGTYSGLCQPTYVLDIPGGHGKACVLDSSIKEEKPTASGTDYVIEDFEGCNHAYTSED